MITGDSKDTAKSIAREMGILDDDRDDTSYDKTIRNDERAGDHHYYYHSHVPCDDTTLTGG